MVAAAEIDPPELVEIGLKAVKHRVPGAAQRREILLAQRVHVDAAHHGHVLFGQLVDGKAQPRMRRARIIARHLALGVQRIDPEAHVEMAAGGPRSIKDGRTAHDLLRRIEDDVIGQPADFREVFRLVGGAIGRDFAVVEFARQPRLPQAGCAHPVKVFADDRGDRPHRERLERGQHPGARRLADVRKDAAVFAQLRGIDHEGGRIDAGKVEAGKGPGIAGSGFHQNASGPASSSTVHGRPCALSIAMNGSGSNCSMLNTPSPRHAPVSIIAAPIIAGTPVV